ncbi:MAG TPA: hypothetical protein PK467_12390 [Candidatus Wallbacteria bacterium]|nr:hypothetical protein [Candidatus Wallbacteria bacterium]
MSMYKNLRIAAAALLAAGMISAFNVYSEAAETKDRPEVKSYKLRIAKDEITAPKIKKEKESAAKPDLNTLKTAGYANKTTDENLIIASEYGVTIIKNDPKKAEAISETTRHGNPRKARFSIENRARWEENGYNTTGGKNFNNSAFTNRTRLNFKMDLNEKGSTNIFSQKAGAFGRDPQDREGGFNDKTFILVVPGKKE